MRVADNISGAYNRARRLTSPRRCETLQPSRVGGADVAGRRWREIGRCEMRMWNIAGGVLCSFTMVAGTVSTAHATTFLSLMASTGYPYEAVGANTAWKNAWTNAWFQIYDGREIWIDQPSAGNTIIQEWAIPIPINSTNSTWNVAPQGGSGDSGFSDAMETMICSYDANGDFSGCGSPVALGGTSSVLVPSSGAAFSVTTFKAECDAGGLCGPSDVLSEIRATN